MIKIKDKWCEMNLREERLYSMFLFTILLICIYIFAIGEREREMKMLSRGLWKRILEIRG